MKEQVVGPVYHFSCGSRDASYMSEMEQSLKHGSWSKEDLVSLSLK